MAGLLRDNWRGLVLLLDGDLVAICSACRTIKDCLSNRDLAVKALLLIFTVFVVFA